VAAAGWREAGVLLIGWHEGRTGLPFSFVVTKRMWLEKKNIQKRASMFLILSLRIHQQFSSERVNKSDTVPTFC
jgi:hypothetical protein